MKNLKLLYIFLIVLIGVISLDTQWSDRRDSNNGRDSNNERIIEAETRAIKSIVPRKQIYLKNTKQIYSKNTMNDGRVICLNATEQKEIDCKNLNSKDLLK